MSLSLSHKSEMNKLKLCESQLVYLRILSNAATLKIVEQQQTVMCNHTKVRGVERRQH